MSDRLMTDTELGVDTVQPRTVQDFRFLCIDVTFNRVDLAEARKRIAFFALNASDTELRELLEHNQ